MLPTCLCLEHILVRSFTYSPPTSHSHGDLVPCSNQFLIGVGLGNSVLDAPGVQDRQSSYASDVFSLIGTVFLFVLFPSFNAALAPDNTQFRVTANTVLPPFYFLCDDASLFLDLRYSVQLRNHFCGLSSDAWGQVRSS